MLGKILYKQERLRRKLSRNLKVLNTVNLSKSELKYNYNFFKKLHPESEICPVLKSNAYGHGITEIARVCEELNPPYIVVDSFYEAFELKKAGIKTPFLIIGYTHPDNYKFMKFANIAVTVIDNESIEALGALKKRIKIHLKVDTGMHRQGIPFKKIEESLELLKKHKKLEFEGICTHLADADNPKNNSFTRLQVKNFKKVLKIVEDSGFSPKWKHVSATSGAGKVFMKNFNMIRLGLGLYGESPLEDSDKYYKKYKFNRLKPVLQLKSTIIDIKKLKKGDCVSYGCRFTAKKTMKIGVIPFGYYEGIDRRLTNKGYIYYRNKPCKILGTVCMNLTMIDLSNVKNPRKWDKVEVIGRDRKKKNTARWMAGACDTITYVIWTHIAPTIRRVFK
jgi:alanine racemase